jgi:hypothetical protein
MPVRTEDLRRVLFVQFVVTCVVTFLSRVSVFSTRSGEPSLVIAVVIATAMTCATTVVHSHLVRSWRCSD